MYFSAAGNSPKSFVEPSATVNVTGMVPLPTAACAVHTRDCTATLATSRSVMPGEPGPLRVTVMSCGVTETSLTVVPDHGWR